MQLDEEVGSPEAVEYRQEDYDQYASHVPRNKTPS
jgi:hypothetical protein